MRVALSPRRNCATPNHCQSNRAELRYFELVRALSAERIVMPEVSSEAKAARRELSELKPQISQLKETLKTTRDNLKTAMDRRNELLKQAGRERNVKKDKKPE
jgi:predicted  nucleic acid-binding Zn-ribbon protein